MALFLCRILLVSFGGRLNAERVKKSAVRLEQIPEAVAGWEWDRTMTARNARMGHVTAGGYNLFVRSYVRPKTGHRLYFQVCRWLDPLSCYEMHGWRVVKPDKPLLRGEEGHRLRAAGMREGWVEKDEEKIALVFWESDLLEPTAIWKGALTEDVGAKGRLTRLWGRTSRRLKSFFQKSDIVAKVIYEGPPGSEQAREAVLEFAREIRRMLPNVLK